MTPSKRINNGFFSGYYLTEAGEVVNVITWDRPKLSKDGRYTLKTQDGNTKRISLRTLYQLVYNRPFCKDNIANLDGEEWREIDLTNGVYYISNLGRIKSYAGTEAKLLHPQKNKSGYYRIDIYQEGQRTTKLIHRLVAAAFLDPSQHIEMQIHHKNFDSSDNRATNLQWLTPAQHKKLHQEERKKNGRI